MDEPTRRALLEIYRDLDDEIAQHRPRCEASGRCCRFDEAGHELFLSEPEAELLFAEPGAGSVRPGRCPYQVGQLCTARERRPIGCRVYFCDQSFQSPQHELSERYIGRLKAACERLDRRWLYARLRWFVENPPTGSSSDGDGNRLDCIPSHH